MFEKAQEQDVHAAVSVLRSRIVELGGLIQETCPPNVERHTALCHLDAVAFYAAASAARSSD